MKPPKINHRSAKWNWSNNGCSVAMIVCRLAEHINRTVVANLWLFSGDLKKKSRSNAYIFIKEQNAQYWNFVECLPSFIIIEEFGRLISSEQRKDSVARTCDTFFSFGKVLEMINNY